MLACQPQAGGSVISRWAEHFLLLLRSQEEHDAIGIQVYFPRPEHTTPRGGSQGPHPCLQPRLGVLSHDPTASRHAPQFSERPQPGALCLEMSQNVYPCPHLTRDGVCLVPGDTAGLANGTARRCTLMGWLQMPNPVLFPRHATLLHAPDLVLWLGKKQELVARKVKQKLRACPFLTCVCADVPLQVEGVIEALATEGAQVPLHLVVALEVPVEHTL